MTALGTTPSVFWWFCSHIRMYQIINDSDITFREKRALRKEADDVFLHALTVQPGGVSWFRSAVCWACLRIFGWIYVNIPSARDVYFEGSWH